MKEYFNTQIKPLNDKLGRNLRSPVQIGVRYVENEQNVTVYYVSRNMRMKVSEYRFFKNALGLSL